MCFAQNLSYARLLLVQDFIVAVFYFANNNETQRCNAHNVHLLDQVSEVLIKSIEITCGF